MAEETPAATPAEAPKAPMRCDIDMDWATYACPCGGGFCTRGRTDAQVDAWMAFHRPHTDDTVLEHVTADGARAYGGEPPADRLTAYPNVGSPPAPGE